VRSRQASRIGSIVGVVVAALVVGQALSYIRHQRFVPPAVLTLGLVFACLSALFAVGLVLVYRASRIINFAHASFGTFASVLFVVLHRQWGYFPALVLSLLAAVLLGAVVEALLVRRFAKAPRLVLTVATLGIFGAVTGAATFIANQLIRFFRGPDALDDGLLAYAGRPETPFNHVSFRWFPVIFTGDHIVMVVVSLAVLAAMAAFFIFTDVGIAVRGAAENSDRAALLGVNVSNLSTLVWVIAAFLSASAAVFLLPVQGFNPLAGGAVAGGLGLLLRALAAAVLGRMEDIPLTVAAAFAISIFEQSVAWTFDDTSLVNVGLFIVIVASMLVQRSRLARTDESVQSTWTATEEIRPIPAELANLAPVRRGVRWLFGGIAAIVLGYPFVASPSQTNQGSLYLIYGIIAISLVILTGWGGQISLGQFAFVAVGAVLGGAVTARAGWPFPVALLIGALAGSGVSVLVGLPALRIKGLYLAVTTLAFSVAVSTVVLNPRYFGWLLPDKPINRPSFIIKTEDERVYYYLCLLALLAAVVAVEGIRRSRTGRVLIAMRDNERTAQSLGINLVRVRLSTFAISGFLAAFAGVLYAHHQHAIDKNGFSADKSVQMFLMAVIGGLGSVRGVLLGAFYIATVNIVFTNSAFQLLASALGVLFVLLLFPGGLGWLGYKLRDAWLRRIATRFRIIVPSLVGDFKAGTGEKAKAELAPKFGAGDERVQIPARYRLPSRIGAAGASQQKPTWRF
jgi:branched-chain amino acid transport system permease protein